MAKLEADLLDLVSDVDHIRSSHVQAVIGFVKTIGRTSRGSMRCSTSFGFSQSAPATMASFFCEICWRRRAKKRTARRIALFWNGRVDRAGTEIG